MNRVFLYFAVLLFFLPGCTGKNIRNNFDANRAFIEFETIFFETYAYTDKPDFDAKSLLADFKGRLVKSNSRQEFRDIAQVFLRHFSDPHLNLGPYNEFDFSVIPTGSDIWASFREGRFFVSDVKKNSVAFAGGILPDDEIIEVDGLTPDEAIRKIFDKSIQQLSKRQIEYGLNVALGGLRYKKRVLKIKRPGQLITKKIEASYSNEKPSHKVSFKKIEDFGYIRFNNSLGDKSTINEFKKALSALLNTKALIIDLRDIPSGGNTGVAEPILGHFTKKPKPYQKYRVQTPETPYSRAKLQTAYTRPSLPLYQKPYVVLVGRWTGSMGEGMAIGFDAIGAKAVIGSPMADLLGGIKKIELPESQSWMEIGFERIYHVNGMYREDFIPGNLIVPSDVDSHGQDPGLKEALDFLRSTT